MSLAIVVSQYPAPSHTFIRREVAALRRLGVRVETFSIRPGACLSDEDRAEAASTFAVLGGGRGSLTRAVLAGLARRPSRTWAALRVALRHALPGLRARLKAVAYFAEGLALAGEMERRGVAHVHGHFANPAAVAGLAASRCLGVGWSVTLHGLSDFGGAMTPRLVAKVEDAAFVVTVTEWGRAELGALCDPAMLAKVHVVRCGIEPGRLPPTARVPPAPGEPLQIVTVGRLAPEKAHRGLIQALATLADRGVRCRLTIVGGGPEEHAIRAEVRARGLSGQVELLGAQPEAVALGAMARAHAFALSSLMEGLPVVLMEALALELPVVAPDLSGIPELVRHGETGLLYPPGDWAALAGRIEELARDPALRARLGAAGRERVLRDFDASRSAAVLADLLVASAPGRLLTPAAS